MKSFSEEMLGTEVMASPVVKRFLSWRPSWTPGLVIGALGLLVLIPYLGAVGLWDCWETHYGEVARSMIQRNDYVYPYWENAYFFSKPVLTMWMMALGMQVVGTNTADGPLGLYTEWGMRLPFALSSVLAAALLAMAVSRVVSRRAGLATGFILLTMPMYFLLARQAVTDTPFVATLVCAMACAMIGQWDTQTRHRAAWWYAFWVFCGLASLAKGVLGLGIPAVVLVLYAVLCVMDWSEAGLRAHGQWLISSEYRSQVRAGQVPMPVMWAQFFRMKLGTGLLVFAAVAVPWYAVMCLFEGVDDEQRVFWYRFFIWDHLSRLTSGVHTTTPGGDFTYFIEQGGFGLFPWVALVPGAVAVVARSKLRSSQPADQLAALSAIWASFSFLLFAMSATKFHHYVLPVLPPIAVLCALFVDRLWEEGIAEHGMSLLFGLVFFILIGHDLATTPKNFTDLFVYNYDRPYPAKLVNDPIVLGNGAHLYTGHVLAGVFLLLGLYLGWDAFTAKAKSVAYRAGALAVGLLGIVQGAAVYTRTDSGMVTAVMLSLAVLAGYLAFEAKARRSANLGTVAGMVGLVAVVLGLRSFLQPEAVAGVWRQLGSMGNQTMNIKSAMGMAFMLTGCLVVVGALLRSKVLMVGSFWGLALGFALWFNWSHWPDLSHHWTQRDLFWKYYRERKPNEPIAAYLMNWRGETLYSKNQVKQIREAPKMLAYSNQPGREWALVEHDRLRLLRDAVKGKVVTPLTSEEMNNKFVLVTIE